jgi:hypothetical protein
LHIFGKLFIIVTILKDRHPVTYFYYFIVCKMKKTFLVLSMAAMLMTGMAGMVSAQDQPKPKKDTVNMDTNAKPTFYYAEEEKDASKSGIPTVAIVAGIAVIVAVGAFLVLRKKKA